MSAWIIADGWVARRLQQESLFGKYLDRIGDHVACFGIFAVQVWQGRIPLGLMVATGAIGWPLRALTHLRANATGVPESTHHKATFAATFYTVTALAMFAPETTWALPVAYSLLTLAFVHLVQLAAAWPSTG